MGSRCSIAGLVAISLGALACATSGRAGDPLRFCLDQSTLTASKGDGKSDHAFDVQVVNAVARKMARPAAIQWYQTGSDSDNNPDYEINALLSDGRCDIVAGYPLLASAIQQPVSERAKLPGFAGSKSEDRRRWVKLGELQASHGYRFSPLVVVLGPAASNLTVQRLSDLKGLKLVVDEGTLGDAVLMSNGGGALIPNITHMSPGEDIFESMERGEYAATLVELPRFDAYVSRHAETRLVSSGHYHSIGFNVGMVGLTTNASLLDQVDDAIKALLGGSELADIAHATHVTYMPPREPNIHEIITAADLKKE
jgi:Bacterial extracellular solute-binding proteins, family 3